MATKEYFPGIGKIKFEGKESKNPMAFRYYDAEKVINGKKMKDWLKFAMAWCIRCVPRAVTSLAAEQRNSLGTVMPIRCRLPRIRWMPALNSCRNGNRILLFP